MRRTDGAPNVRASTIYSERQRVIVLTFPTVEAAKAFDQLETADIAGLLVEVPE